MVNRLSLKSGKQYQTGFFKDRNGTEFREVRYTVVDAKFVLVETRKGIWTKYPKQRVAKTIKALVKANQTKKFHFYMIANDDSIKEVINIRNFDSSRWQFPNGDDAYIPNKKLLFKTKKAAARYMINSINREINGLAAKKLKLMRVAGI